MAKDLNTVMLTGRLGQEPEIRITPQGTTVTQFPVASQRSWTDGDGATRDHTEWFTVVAWDKLGEICGAYLRRGSHVLIEGRLQTRAWDDPDSGQPRVITEVIASDLIMLDAKRDAGAVETNRTSVPGAPPPAAGARRTATSALAPPAPRRPSRPRADDEDFPF